jgi:phosphate acetyltransferase
LGSGVGKTLEELVDSLYLAYDSLKLKMSASNYTKATEILNNTEGLRSSLPTETFSERYYLVSSKQP